jgi:hypothetical protein
MNTNPLLALATAAALPPLEYESWNVTRDWTKVFRLADGADDSTGILVDLSPHGIASPEIEALQAARARYVAAACNAVRGLVQERELLLEACKKASENMDMMLVVLTQTGHDFFVSSEYTDAMKTIRAAVAEAEAGGE